MLNKNIFFLVAITAASVSGIFMLLEKPQESASPAIQMDKNDLVKFHNARESDSDIREMLLSLQSELHSIRNELDNFKQSQTNERSEDPQYIQSTSAETNTTVDDADLIQQEEQRTNQITEYISNSHASQITDQVWSTEIGSQIQHIFLSDDLAGISLSSVDCRSSLCRMEFQLDDAVDTQQVQFNLTHKLTELLPRGTMREITEANGQTKMLAFFSRPGHQLPALQSDSSNQEIP